MSFDFEEGTGFSAFALYNAIKLHFTSDSYDFFRYNGKSNVSKTSFSSNKNKYSFYKLSRKYNLDDLKYFYIANMLEKSDQWIGNIIGPEGDEVYLKWKKISESLSYSFEQDIIYILEKYGDDAFKVKNGEHPKLLVEVQQGKVNKETLIILNELMNFFPIWDKKIQDDIIWPDLRRKYLKYAPFIKYDKNKFKNILKEKIKENAEV